MKLNHVTQFLFVSAIYLAGGVALAADAGTATGTATGTSASTGTGAGTTMSTSSTAATGSTGGSAAATMSQQQVDSMIAARFSSFAGSSANADSLALGLRNGTPVTLSSVGASQSSTVTFNPPTGHMGWGNVTRALTLTQRELAALGITQPTANQLKAALTGGTVTTGSGSTTQTVTLPGVLQLRSQGMGWGQIAHTIGVSPGNKGGLSAGASAGAGIRTGANTSAAGSISGRPSFAQRVKQENEVEVENEADHDRRDSGRVASGITTGVGASAGGLTTAAGASGGESLHSQRGIVQAGGGSGFAFSGEGHQSGMVTGAGRADGGLAIGRGRGKH